MTTTSQLPTDKIALGNAIEWLCYFKEEVVSIKIMRLEDTTMQII
jgi:hypothetical protein